MHIRRIIVKLTEPISIANHNTVSCLINDIISLPRLRPPSALLALLALFYLPAPTAVYSIDWWLIAVGHSRQGSCAVVYSCGY